MTRRLPRWLALVAICLILAPPLEVSAAAGQLNGWGVLWRISSRAAAPSYLFGTFHVTDERVLRLPAEVFEAFDACENFLFELIVPQDGGEWSTIPFMGLPRNVHLRDLVGREAFDKLVVHATRYGISTNELTWIHPWALASIFSQPPAEWFRRREGWAFLDQALQNEARAMGKKLHALETMEEQFAPDEILPRINLADSVISMLEYSFQAEAEFETAVRDYLARNIAAVFDRERAAMGSLSGKERELMREYDRRMLDVRNRRMVERSMTFLGAGRVFIAVGAAHLPGKNGLVQMFRRRGFKVDRVY